MITNIISAIIVLGVLVFVHELGHFLFAKKLGVGVTIFSLGFGPKLIGWQKGETLYQIAAFPLGGFVKMIGENPREEVSAKDRVRSFTHQPVRKRAAIVAAGPVFNLLFAAVLFSSMNLFGIPYVTPKIGEVTPGLPAENAGIKKGDVVLAVNGQEVKKWDNLSKMVRDSNGNQIVLKIKRDGQIREIPVIPQPSKTKNAFGEEVQYNMIGIAPSDDLLIEKVGPLASIAKGLAQTWQAIELTIVSIVKMIERVIPAKMIGGPILIAQVAGEMVKRGLRSFVSLMALLSVNLGIINLFPIPILDGGYFPFLLAEAILRRPISIKKMENAQQIGLILVIMLMLFAFYNDILRIITPGGMKF